MKTKQELAKEKLQEIETEGSMCRLGYEWKKCESCHGVGTTFIPGKESIETVECKQCEGSGGYWGTY